VKEKGCYAPFSLQVIIGSATPRKPSPRPPTGKLVTRLRKNAQELLTRSLAGQPDAMKEFCRFAHNLTRQLAHLSESKEEEVREIASTYEKWPILYAPDDQRRHQQQLQQPRQRQDPRAIYDNLHVGTDSLVERYAGRKIDRENHWTNLALLVLEQMRWCKERLPEIIRNQPCRRILRWVIRVGKTKIRIYYYDTPGGVFEVPEWCELCPSLPEKLRLESVADFWKPARLALLQYWYENERAGGSAYAEALKLAYHGKHGLESERRNNALGAIKGAMASLAGKNKT
jgi:hypothetical protein